MNRKKEFDEAARESLARSFSIGGFFRSILSEALTAVVIFVLLALIVVVGVAWYLGVSFTVALGICLIVVVFGWAASFFSDAF